MLVLAMGQQTEALSQLAACAVPKQDPLDLLDSGGDCGTELPARLGRGPAALESLHQKLSRDPNFVYERVASNCKRLQSGASAADIGHGHQSMKGYLVKQVPFHNTKQSIYFMFLLAEIFDLLQEGMWERARALVAMSLVAGEQAALDQWSWSTAWLLTGLPDPPFHLLQHSLGASLTRPAAKLADHGWIAAAAAYIKEMSILQETRKNSRTQQHQQQQQQGQEDGTTRPPRRPRNGAPKGEAGGPKKQDK